MEELRTTKIIRMGTSLGLIVPAPIVKGMGWKRGDRVVFTFSDNDYLLVKRPSDIELRQLKKVTKDGDLLVKADGSTERVINV